jgi:hypothetical protein
MEQAMDASARQMKNNVSEEVFDFMIFLLKDNFLSGVIIA